jgi:hypothetical protein
VRASWVVDLDPVVGSPLVPPLTLAAPLFPFGCSRPLPSSFVGRRAPPPPSLPHSQVLAAAIPYNPSCHPPISSSPSVVLPRSDLLRVVQVSSGELVGRTKEEKVELKVILRLSMFLR